MVLVLKRRRSPGLGSREDRAKEQEGRQVARMNGDSRGREPMNGRFSIRVIWASWVSPMGGLNAGPSTAHTAFTMCGPGLVLAWDLKTDSENRQSPLRGTKSRTDADRCACHPRVHGGEGCLGKGKGHLLPKCIKKQGDGTKPHADNICTRMQSIARQTRNQCRTLMKSPVFLLTTSKLTCVEINVKIIEIEFEFNFT